uniref:BHLH domain-containing protein n=1 Tax=Fagus sylvatica TaxID=28930 RepID=A0A2N9HAH5_FAGSY
MDHLDVWPRLDDPLYLETSDNLWPLLGESSISKPIIEDDNINDVLDPSVFLEQEHSAFVESRNIVEGLQENVLNFHKDDNLSTINIDPSMLAESSTDKVIVGKGVNSKSTRERNNGFKRKQPRKKVVETNGEEGSVVKKQDHNAKERVRRKNLNASYLALGSMLPLDSRRIKGGV